LYHAGGGCQGAVEHGLYGCGTRYPYPVLTCLSNRIGDHTLPTPPVLPPIPQAC